MVGHFLLLISFIILTVPIMFPKYYKYYVVFVSMHKKVFNSSDTEQYWVLFTYNLYLGSYFLIVWLYYFWLNAIFIWLFCSVFSMDCHFHLMYERFDSSVLLKNFLHLVCHKWFFLKHIFILVSLLYELKSQ